MHMSALRYIHMSALRYIHMSALRLRLQFERLALV